MLPAFSGLKLEKKGMGGKKLHEKHSWKGSSLVICIRGDKAKALEGLVVVYHFLPVRTCIMCNGKDIGTWESTHVNYIERNKSVAKLSLEIA